MNMTKQIKYLLICVINLFILFLRIAIFNKENVLQGNGFVILTSCYSFIKILFSFKRWPIIYKNTP